jgi:hypothetical protein
VVAATTTNQTVATIGTLPVDGQQLKVRVQVTMVDDAVDSNAIAYSYEEFFYRSGATITGFTAFDNQTSKVGTAGFTGGVSLNVVPQLSSILLRVSNSDSVGYTLNTAIQYWTQEGGFNS